MQYFTLEVHRIGKFPSGWTSGQKKLGRIPAGPNNIPTISDKRLFSELGNEYDEKQSERLIQKSGKHLF